MTHELTRLVEDLRREEGLIRQGGGAKAIARQHEKGRLTARERIAGLIDPDTTFFELGLWAAWDMYADWGGAPSAGVVTGIGTVSGRRVMVIANDATVKAGAFFPMTCKKVLRAQRIALENRLPLVYLVDSRRRLPAACRTRSFPTRTISAASSATTPSSRPRACRSSPAILGNCVAGGGYLPVLCDKLLMTEGSGLYLAGPALVKAAIGQTVSHEDLGGAQPCTPPISGTIDFRETDEPACLERLRRLVGMLPRRLPRDQARHLAGPARRRSAEALSAGNPRQEYDIRDLLPCILDAGPFDEYKAEYGQTLVCGYGRLGGVPVGVVANQHKRCQPASGPLQYRRRHLRRQRRQGRPLHHGLQPDAACRCCSCRTSTASWSAAIRSRPASSGRGPSWSTSSPTASCRRSR